MKNRKGQTQFLLWTIAFVLVAGTIMGGVALWKFGFSEGSINSRVNAPGPNVVTPDITLKEIGKAATISQIIYDRESASGTSTLSDATFTYVDQSGAVVKAEQPAGSTMTGVASTGDVLFTGANSTTIYVDTNPQGYGVTKETLPLLFDGYDIAAEASMIVRVTDPSTSDSTLTAGVNTTRTDYNISLGASQPKRVDIDLTNNDDYSAFRVGMLCTFAGPNGTSMSYYRVIDSNWQSVAVPEEMKTAQITILKEGGSLIQSGFDNCYIPIGPKAKFTTKGGLDISGFYHLHGYDSLSDDADGRIKTEVKSAATDPVCSPGSDAFFGAQFVDYGCQRNKDGINECGPFHNDDDQQVTEVGLVDLINSPMGLTTGFVGTVC